MGDFRNFVYAAPRRVEPEGILAYTEGLQNGFQIVEENLRQSFRAMAVCRASGQAREMPGLTIASLGVTFQMFNAAFLSAAVMTESELQQRISHAEVYFRARKLDWSLWMCEDWMDPRVLRRCKATVQARGLSLAAELPGMQAEFLKPAPRPDAPLHIRRVENEPVRLAFCDIGSVCFNVPLTWFREVFAVESLWRDFVGWVGYANGEPVSTAATVTGAGAIGVYNVATLPGHQRKGYAETVMRHALEWARLESGVERTILQSTTQGLRLYERMGYRAVTRFSVYAT